MKACSITIDMFFMALATSRPSCLLILTLSLSKAGGGGLVLDLGPLIGGLCSTSNPDDEDSVCFFYSVVSPTFCFHSSFFSCLNLLRRSTLSFRLTDDAESSLILEEAACYSLSFLGKYTYIPGSYCFFTPALALVVVLGFITCF